MGLFIGASLLTILEIFDYLYEVRPPSPARPAPRLGGCWGQGALTRLPQVFRDKLLSFYRERKRSPRSDSSTLVTTNPHPDTPNPLPWHSRHGVGG